MTMSWLIAVLSVWVVSAVVLLSALRVVKVLGHRGLMEMILVMVSVLITVTVTGQRLNTGRHF